MWDVYMAVLSPWNLYLKVTLSQVFAILLGSSSLMDDVTKMRLKEICLLITNVSILLIFIRLSFLLNFCCFTSVLDFFGGIWNVALNPAEWLNVMCRSGVRHTNVLLRGAVFRTFSINFFTYGFPVYIPETYYNLHSVINDVWWWSYDSVIVLLHWCTLQFARLD